ncbi:IclR family transcriptional regulator [Bacillus sp. ISL-4]|uniref:IclR family transcriptional regulator n=1 Tax=Bacillus sp. ISL-4 TaxID=2819125 RepID=UPI001BEA41CF|nr:IclR family transcriptional regulator [Bacillus sp. ISL-4]MBT2669139.1 IclR family transcriptional regulator [Bacillus sp. ISL-4]MBT2674627.1 IclR family transcriptional regulator [Streptomyces sp. ISL-14]
MDYNIKSVERAFEIVEALALKSRLPSELSKQLNINKSTLHRFLSTLQDLGYVDKHSDNSFSLSQSFINLGVKAQNQYNIVAICKPYLLELAERFQESALLATFNGYRCQYEDKMESSYTVRIVFDSGKTAPAHAVASGKVFLASLENERLHEYMESEHFTSYTKNTITDKDELIAELSTIKRLGYAVDNEEYEIGLQGFACPIKDAEGKTIRTICLAGIAGRIKERNNPNDIVTALLKASQEISTKMGYQSSKSLITP